VPIRPIYSVVSMTRGLALLSGSTTEFVKSGQVVAVGFCPSFGWRVVSMWSINDRTTRRCSGLTVLLLVVLCTSAVSVDGVSHDVDEVRAPTDAERHPRRAWSGRHRHVPSQSVSNCTAVHQFAVETLHYSNELPVTKRHGTFTVVS